LLGHAAGAELADFEQIRDVLADVFESELIGRPFEVACKFLHAPQVGAGRAFGIVPSHQFIGHRLT
jgi:hypothetical protein